MFEAWIYTILSVIVVSMIALIGVVTISIKEQKLRKMLLYFVSFSTGALFGDAFIHLLPEAVETSGFGLGISLYILFGIVVSFFVEKFIRWTHCHHPASEEHVHPVVMMNMFGDSVHNFIDGLIIAASYLVSLPLGIATTLAVVLHEIPQEIGDFAIMLHGGFTKRKAIYFNFLTALTAVVGAIVALVISSYVEGLTIFLIPFAAGGFIYIAGSDLIPELHKEVKARRSLVQFVCFLVGIGVMMLLLVVK